MGNRFAKDHSRETVLVGGVPGSGHTSLLSKLKPGDEEMHDLERQQETLDLNDKILTFWDLYGRVSYRPVFQICPVFPGAVVYIIISTEREMLDEAVDELIKFILLDERSRGAVIMVLANKQDIRGAMSALEIQEAMKKKYKFSSKSSFAHTVFVRPCSLHTSEGVNEAFQDFAEQLRLKQEGKAKTGLLPLARIGRDKNAKDFNVDEIGAQEQTESLAHSKVKRFFKNPFCLFKTNG